MLLLLLLPSPPALLSLLPAPGANLANGWMMRPGASVIEFTPYQFETVRGSFVFSVTNGWVRLGCLSTWPGWCSTGRHRRRCR